MSLEPRQERLEARRVRRRRPERQRERVDDPAAAGVDRYVGLEHLDPGDLKVQRWGDARRGYLLSNARSTRPDSSSARVAPISGRSPCADFEAYLLGAHPASYEAIPATAPGLLAFPVQSDYFLRSRNRHLGRVSIPDASTGATSQGSEFDLPPLAEQRRIADLLWAVETHRRACRATAALSTHGRAAVDRATSASRWP